jgi:hypothetical protein
LYSSRPGYFSNWKTFFLFLSLAISEELMCVVLNQGHNEMGLPMAAILYMWNLYTIFHLKSINWMYMLGTKYEQLREMEMIS